MIDNILCVTYNTNYISENTNYNSKTDKKGRVKI